MKNITKVFCVLICIVASASCVTEDNGVYTTTEIKCEQIQEPLFLKTKNWGLTGDSQITIISTDNNVDFNKKESEDYYVFHGLAPFFYKQSNDSLILYSSCSKVKVPKNFKKKWKIVEVVVDNPTYVDFYHNNKYKKP